MVFPNVLSNLIIAEALFLYLACDVLVVLDFLSAIFPSDTTELLSGDSTTAVWGRLLLGETGGRCPVRGDGIRLRCAGRGCSLEL